MAEYRVLNGMHSDIYENVDGFYVQDGVLVLYVNSEETEVDVFNPENTITYSVKSPIYAFRDWVECLLQR